MPGAVVSATQADYGLEHLRRLRVIRALSDVAGLPLQKIKIVLALIEHPGDDLFETLGRAITALPPYLNEGGSTDGGLNEGRTDENNPDEPIPDFPRARAALEKLGQVYDPQFIAVAQLDRALDAVADAGIPLTDDRLAAYAEHLRAIAAFDLSRMPASSAQASVEYAVLGTALYEPVIVALRRLAHQDLASRMLPDPTEQPGPSALPEQS